MELNKNLYINVFIKFEIISCKIHKNQKHLSKYRICKFDTSHVHNNINRCLNSYHFYSREIHISTRYKIHIFYEVFLYDIFALINNTYVFYKTEVHVRLLNYQPLSRRTDALLDGLY